MDIVLSIVVGVGVVACLLAVLVEYRIRQPDVLVLYESKGQIGVRKGLVYPRHFSLPLKRTTCPIQFTIEASAAGNLGVRVKLVGSVAPSLKHIQALIRVGGWNARSSRGRLMKLKFCCRNWSKNTPSTLRLTR